MANAAKSTENRTTTRVSSFRSPVSIRLQLSSSHENAYRAYLKDGGFEAKVEIDAQLIRAFLKPGEGFLDGGANIGMTALLALEAGAGAVLAVEPARDVADRLEDNFTTFRKTFSKADLRVSRAALADRSGRDHLLRSTQHEQGSTLDSRTPERFPGVFGEQMVREEVALSTIDELLVDGPACAVWKLDLEGFEAAALRGAQEVLASSPPRAIILECYDSDDLAAIVDTLEPFGLQGFRVSADAAGSGFAVMPLDADGVEAPVGLPPMYVFAATKDVETATEPSSEPGVRRVTPPPVPVQRPRVAVDLHRDFSKSERYAAFLYTYLPRLRAAALYPDTMLKDEPWRGDVLIATLDRAKHRPGIFMEVGVYKGNSIRVCARRQRDRRFVGFDSFEGFPEDGRHDWNQNFAVAKLPDVPPNVELVKGWFSDTLPAFCQAQDFKLAFLNIDCDIYSSTVDVFGALGNAGKLHPGLVIYFDELINYATYLQNEALALFEFLDESRLGIQWLCCHDKVRLLSDTLHLLETGNHPTWVEDVDAGYRQQAGLVLTGDGLDLSALAVPHLRKRIQRLASRMPSADAAVDSGSNLTKAGVTP